MTTPTIPFNEYGGALLTHVAETLTTVFPYAAAITAFAIGVGMVKRWLGHRPATSLGSSPRHGYEEYTDDESDYYDPSIRQARSDMPGYGNRHNRRRGNQWGHS